MTLFTSESELVCPQLKLLHPVGQILDSLPSQIRRKSVRWLHGICGHQALLPRSFGIPLCYDPAGDPLCHGGFADVWMGRYEGRDVAAKVLRVYLKDGFGKAKRVGCLRGSQFVTCTNELNTSRIEVLQGGCNMEDPLSSERATAVRRDDDRDSVCDGIGVDDKW